MNQPAKPGHNAAQPFDVCVRGAGIVGRVVALLLAKAHLRVALVATPRSASSDGLQTTPDGHSDVRAYALNHVSRACLESLRCWPKATAATAVTAMQVWGDDGGEVQFQAAQAGADALAWIVDVPALEGLLAQATEFQALIETVAAPVPASLTVVCEGRASQTRDEWGVEFDVTPYGHSALAARLQLEMAHGGAARQWFVPPAQALEGGPGSGPAGEILALLPLDAPSMGNSAALVWSVQDEHADALMAMSDADFCSALQGACGGAVGQAVGNVRLCAPRQRWPLQLARAKQWVGVTRGQTWALAGDAAHSVHPLSGQGLNLGLADAVELARVLAAREDWRPVSDLKPLRAFERARKLDAALLAGATDGLQRLFAQSHPAAAQLRNRGMGWFDAAWSLKSLVARRAMGLKA